jgi:hypothetical protein
MPRQSTPGVLYVHSRTCKGTAHCSNNCNPSPTPWQAWVYDANYVDPATGTRGKKIKRRDSHAAAKGWRADASGQLRAKTLKAVDTAVARQTLSEAVAEWLANAEAGEILSKREEPYKPAVLRNYELSLRLRVLPHLGHRRFADVTLGDLIGLKEKLQGTASTGRACGTRSFR